MTRQGQYEHLAGDSLVGPVAVSACVHAVDARPPARSRRRLERRTKGRTRRSQGAVFATCCAGPSLSVRSARVSFQTAF